MAKINYNELFCKTLQQDEILVEFGVLNKGDRFRFDGSNSWNTKRFDTGLTYMNASNIRLRTGAKVLVIIKK